MWCPNLSSRQEIVPSLRDSREFTEVDGEPRHEFARWLPPQTVGLVLGTSSRHLNGPPEDGISLGLGAYRHA
jgi:hypothetical protein